MCRKHGVMVWFYSPVALAATFVDATEAVDSKSVFVQVAEVFFIAVCAVCYCCLYCVQTPSTLGGTLCAGVTVPLCTWRCCQLTTRISSVRQRTVLSWTVS